MKNYKVWLEKNGENNRHVQQLNGAVIPWEDLQRLIGEKLLECQSAKMTYDNEYTFYGKYLSRDEYLPFTYSLSFEVTS